MGSNESHFNVSLIVRDKVTNKTVSTNQNLFEEKGGSKPNALPLGQTGSHRNGDDGDYDEVLLYVHRNRRLIRDGSPGRLPRLSHSS